MLNRRQRVGYLLLCVFLGHVVLISAQVNARRGTSVLQSALYGSLSDVQRLVSSSLNQMAGLWRGYVFLRGAHEENMALRETVARLQFSLQQQNALVQRNHSLQQLLELRESVDLLTLSARVIAFDTTPWFRTLSLSRGASDGVRQDLPVLAPTGVVGRVVGLPGLRASKVQLLIDRNAAVGAVIERTRAAGVVVGTGEDSILQMNYVSNRKDVRVGDLVVTSSTDGIFPKGFTIGAVVSEEHGGDLYKSIMVEPAVDFTDIEDVLIVIADERLAGTEGFK